jgi:outer membrane lipoprotein-sorting protein
MKSISSLLIISLIGLFTATPAFAQKDAKAKELLDKTSAALGQSGGLSASFTVNINDGVNKIKQSFEGQIFVKGEKFYLDTPDQAVYFDGKTQWAYNKSVNEVNILEPQSQDVQTLNPVSVFDLYKTDCDYKYKGEKISIQKQKVQEVSLLLKNNKEGIRQVDIQIKPDDRMPVFFLIINKDKSEYRIYINKYQTKLNLSDSQFVFDTKKYPKAEVNDLR